MMRFVVAALLVGGAALIVPRYLDSYGWPAFMERAEPGRDNAQNAVVSGGYQVVLQAGPDGHFVANAVVNGRSMDVLIDTGATSVILPQSTAHRLGVEISPDARPVTVSTANGRVQGVIVELSEVRIGPVGVTGVEAIVLPDESLEVNLLGMSFLRKLRKFESVGGQLVLTR